MIYIYEQAGVGERNKNAMLLKEALDETNRLKSNCSAKRSMYAFLMVHCLLLLSRYGYVRAPNPCFKSMHETTEKSNANMRYPKSLTPSPTVTIYSGKG